MPESAIQGGGKQDNAITSNMLGNKEPKNVIGYFVESKSHGIGKVIALEGARYKVEFFISPWKRKTVSADLGANAPRPLWRQTRVFVEKNGAWRMGRAVMEYDREDGGYDYRVQFPNRVVEEIAGEHIFARCDIPFDDPTATLACGAMETQFWHDRRIGFGQQLLSQRAACRGLYGFISARIELVPHQIEVARRVVEDPLQRYLLADEVGMGKTIEAGLVVRHLLVSETEGNVLILAPATLCRQWERELKQKFSIGQSTDRVIVCSFEEVSEIPIHNAPRLLVIDEAHHLVSDAVPEWLATLGGRVERLLLLTATPSLQKTEVLLRLLKLIDPDSYMNVSAPAFKERVTKREEFGIFLRGLRADATPLLLRQRLRRIPDLFPGDAEVARLSNSVTMCLDSEDKASLPAHIAELRSHVADVYRIHHRLVRTRRSDAAPWVFRPRGSPVGPDNDGDLSHVIQIYVEEPGADELFDLLEQWRVEMASRHPIGTSERETFVGVYLRLFETFGCGLSAFLRELRSLPDAVLAPDWRHAFEMSAPKETPKGPGARTRQIARSIRTYIENFMVRGPKRIPRIAVFGSDAEDLVACVASLRSELGNRVVLDAAEFDSRASDVAREFAENREAKVLVCGTANEEGLNLHFADLLVHLDLPFAPTRIEQRIGRLDRFGRKQERVDQRIVTPGLAEEELSPWEGWKDVLAHAFHIFNAPVADVQFVLAEVTSRLSDALFEGGAAGMRALVAEVRNRLKDEREHLDNQHALDRVLQDEEAASAFCEALEHVEMEEDGLALTARDWLARCLCFDCAGDVTKICRFRWKAEETLLPVHPWGKVFAEGLKGSHTFSRLLALGAADEVQLLRVGSPLYHAAEAHYRWDDRGTAFATWRWVPDLGAQEWLSFKLCYTIEAGVPKGVRDGEVSSVRPRLDWFLPPWMDVMYIDPGGIAVTDAMRIELLGLPYNPQGSEVPQQYRDYNLGSRQKALYNLIDPGQFESLCRAIREQAERWLREQPRFQESLAIARERGEMDVKRRTRRLQIRRLFRAAAGEADSTVLREVELNQLVLEGLSNPVVRLDSIGAIVLSGRQPEVAAEETT